VVSALLVLAFAAGAAGAISKRQHRRGSARIPGQEAVARFYRQLEADIRTRWRRWDRQSASDTYDTAAVIAFAGREPAALFHGSAIKPPGRRIAAPFAGRGLLMDRVGSSLDRSFCWPSYCGKREHESAPCRGSPWRRPSRRNSWRRCADSASLFSTPVASPARRCPSLQMLASKNLALPTDEKLPMAAARAAGPLPSQPRR